MKQSSTLSAEDRDLLARYHHGFDDEKVDIDLIICLLYAIHSQQREGSSQLDVVLFSSVLNVYCVWCCRLSDNKGIWHVKKIFRSQQRFSFLRLLRGTAWYGLAPVERRVLNAQKLKVLVIWDIFPSVLWHCCSGDRKSIWPVKSWMLVCWWWRSRLGLCTCYSCSCHHHFHHP